MLGSDRREFLQRARLHHKRLPEENLLVREWWC